MAFGVVEEALRHVSRATVPDIGPANWVVMVGTLGVNLFVAWYEAREGRRLGSAYLLADAAHTRSDIYVTLGVVASFAGARAGRAPGWTAWWPWPSPPSSPSWACASWSAPSTP